MAEYVDAPLEVIEAELLPILDTEPTTIFYQKFTCEACDERVTILEENRLFTMGRHDECPVEEGHITDLRLKGCNYMLVRSNTLPIYDGESQR